MKFIFNFVKNNRQQIGKFCVVGFTAAVIDFGLLYVLTDWFGLYYLASATISFVVAATYNYYLNRRWTFCSAGSKRKQMPIFFVIAIIGILINNFILYLGVEQFALHYLVAKVIATAIVTGWNFFGNKYLTFRIE